MKEELLSNELLIGLEMYRLRVIKNESIYLQKLADKLKGKINSKRTISKAIDVLIDLGMIYSKWEQLENGHWAKVFDFAGEAKELFKKIHEDYYPD